MHCRDKIPRCPMATCTHLQTSVDGIWEYEMQLNTWYEYKYEYEYEYKYK